MPAAVARAPRVNHRAGGRRGGGSSRRGGNVKAGAISNGSRRARIAAARRRSDKAQQRAPRKSATQPAARGGEGQFCGAAACYRRVAGVAAAAPARAQRARQALPRYFTCRRLPAAALKRTKKVQTGIAVRAAPCAVAQKENKKQRTYQGINSASAPAKEA